MQELQQLCAPHREDAATRGDGEDYNNQTDQAFTELLSSMWREEEDEDNEGVDTDGGRDEERGLEGERQASSDLASGDGEIREEKVNEEELEEIYEFAATQRKREEEKDSVEEEEEEETVDEEEDGEEVFMKLTEPKRSSTGFSVKNLQPDPSLDRSYSRLFSGSWGVYEEVDPSSLPSTSAAGKTHTPQSQQHECPHKPSPEPSGRTLLQSSASVVDNLSLSPLPSTSSLPIPGQSPGQVGDWGTDAVEQDVPKEEEREEDLPLKRESQGPRSICAPLSPDSPQKKKEPELIVLSDSSEEMEMVLSSRSPSPRPLQSYYTQVKPAQSILRPSEPTMENKKSSSSEFSPDDPPAAPVQSPPGSGCDQSPVDWSPEVSWLIPSTPVQHVRSTVTSSTQTKSSMCRTQLFPKGDTSSPSVFSSPTLPFNNRLQTSNSPARASAQVGPTEGSVSGLKLDEAAPCSSTLDLQAGASSKRTSRCDVSKDKEVFHHPSSPMCQPKLSHPSRSTYSKHDTPLQLHPQPCSSTPLHAELHQPPIILATSPLRRSTSQGRERTPSESPEKTNLGSFHLSPLSDPSDLPSSSSHRGLQSSQRHSNFSSQSRHSVESSSHSNTGPELKRNGIRNEEGEGEMEHENEDTGDGGEQEEAKVETGEAEAAEFSLQQSFVDEPPIAFNDSWGLDACVDANPGCFSLRLEDSRGSSQQERSPGQQETARSSSSTDCQPSPSGHCIQSSKSHGSATASSSSKALGTQPSASVQSHTGPSFSPSPPDPTTPQINSLLDSKIWDSWEEEEEEALPLSQRVNPSAQLKTPSK